MDFDVHFQCIECADDYEVTLGRVECDCGGVLDLRFEEPAFPDFAGVQDMGLTRYGALLPVEASLLERASLGLGRTPLLAMGEGILAKCDYVSPSGSFKDRGAQVLTSVALSLGATRVVLDSSGNAGAAMAAHCARVGLPCTVVVPASAPAQKLSQSRSYGAAVEMIEGGRAKATEIARSLAEEPGTFYGSHVENPFFLEGTKTWAYEVVEQIGDAPAEVVMSVGNGSLFIGAYKGFRSLYEQGLTSRIPKMTAVQARGWSPLAGDLEHGNEAPLADGIAIEQPRRLSQIAQILEETGGEVQVMEKSDVVDATAVLGRRGFWVEPTTGAAWGALAGEHREDPGPVVVSLGGAGFKKPSLNAS